MNRWEDVEILSRDHGWFKIKELCPVHQVGEGRLTKTSLRLRAEGGGHEGGEEPVPRHDEGAVLPQVPRTGQVQKQLYRPEFIVILPIHMRTRGLFCILDPVTITALLAPALIAPGIDHWNRVNLPN